LKPSEISMASTPVERNRIAAKERRTGRRKMGADELAGPSASWKWEVMMIASFDIVRNTVETFWVKNVVN